MSRKHILSALLLFTVPIRVHAAEGNDIIEFVDSRYEETAAR
jgi:hypothetical protein